MEVEMNVRLLDESTFGFFVEFGEPLSRRKNLNID